MENIQTIESVANNIALILPAQGRTIITGVAGIGKTYLARLLCAALGAQGPEVVEFDALTPKEVEALPAAWGAGCHAILCAEELPDLPGEAIVSLTKRSDGGVHTLVSMSAGSFKIN